MAFAPYCSLPELEACMNVWQFMEMIHSRSYTYIIKNVYSDPVEVFDTILQDEKILERAESVTSSYDDFVNDVMSTILVICGSMQWKDTQQELTTDMNSNGNSTSNRQCQYSGRNTILCVICVFICIR